MKSQIEGARRNIPTGKDWEKRKHTVYDIRGFSLISYSELNDHVGLAGRLCVWLASEKKPWLSGRYLDSRWDLEELERRRSQIVGKDQLKFRLVL
jgi:hypothetical protein